MKVVRVWANKYENHFNPKIDSLILDFDLEKSQATEHLRRYFEGWTYDEWNQKVIDVVGGTYPHFDMWFNEIDEVASELGIEDEDQYEQSPVLKEMIDLERKIESELQRHDGILFLEVEDRYCA
jgi:hypothetical protein